MDKNGSTVLTVYTAELMDDKLNQAQKDVITNNEILNYNSFWARTQGMEACDTTCT